MGSESLNPVVLALDDSHPAKAFLLAFIGCRNNCVGLELDPDVPVDQEWDSHTDGRVRCFSGFAYEFLSLDIALDGFHQTIPSTTESTTNWPWNFPRMRSLMHECSRAARQSGNHKILKLTDQVLEMMGLWERYLSYRKDLILKSQ